MEENEKILSREMSMDSKYTLYVISHTHWDREWYQTFEGYRKRLVYMMDELIDHMEKDDGYKYFHMDGQTVVLEDYLEIRPENEQRLRDLIKSGRLIIGPWYVMPDEFLVSGESLVRNLQLGFEISAEYDTEPMKNGYVVDIFGHNSQFPQTLNGFGINSAVLYRGIGDYPRDTFIWKAVDGSSVLCCKLDRERSYSNFYFAVRWPFDVKGYEEKELVIRMRELLEFSKGLAVTKNLLMMDGVDHMEIEPKLEEIIGILNKNMPDIEIKHARLEDYVQAQIDSGAQFDEITGELYNVAKQGVNNQVLKNVLSSMVHLKQMNNECEMLLTKWAEPFRAAAGYIKPQNTEGFFRKAWKYLLLNHPHDSICGCSITRVHQDNEYRYDQVKDISAEIIDMELNDITASIDTSSGKGRYGLVLFNAGQNAYNGVIEAELRFPAGSQGNFTIYDIDGNTVPNQVLDVKKDHLKVETSFRRLPQFLRRDHYRVAFMCSIPPIGYSTYSYDEQRSIGPSFGDYAYKEFYAPHRYTGSMQTGYQTWENEFLKVFVNNNGTLDVIQKETEKEYRNLLVFEDMTDIGDGWCYRSPVKNPKYMSIDGKCDFTVEYDGGMSVQWKFVYYMDLPAAIREDKLERSNEKKQFAIETTVTMRKDSRLLDFKTVIENNITDHRVRVLFPNYMDTDRFYTSTPFFLQKRSIKKNDTSDYLEIDTGVYPDQGLVMLKDDKDMFALYNRGLYEVEIKEDASHTAALTLFRSFASEVGRNKGEMSFMKRKMTFEYALEFSPASNDTGDTLVSAEAWRMGTMYRYTGSHGGSLPDKGSFLRIDIPGAILSSFRHKDDMDIVRIYNCTEKETEGDIELYRVPDKLYILDLKDDIKDKLEFDGRKSGIKLKAAQILTIGIRYL
jgi:mannosylglycerate hydrolase